MIFYNQPDMDSPFAMTDAEYAELLEYEVVTEEAPQYYIDPRRLCDYLDLTNINLDELEWPVEVGIVYGVVESVEQEDDHESVRASSVRIKSEPLSEKAITTVRTGSVEVKEEELSQNGIAEEDWVDVAPPTARDSPAIKESPSERAGEYIPTPPGATPWTIPEGRFVYQYPSPAATELIDEDDEEALFDKMAKDLLDRIINIDKDEPAVEDDMAIPGTKKAKDTRHTEPMDESLEDETPMDCTRDFMPLQKALLHPDTTAKLKSARCRRSPGFRRSPSNGSLSSTGSSSSLRSPKRAERQKKDIFRKTLHKIREVTVDRVVIEASPFR